MKIYFLLSLILAYVVAIAHVPIETNNFRVTGQSKIKTKDIVVQLKEGTSPLRFASEHGLKYTGAILKNVAPNIYLFQATSSRYAIDGHNTALVKKLQAHGDVDWVEPQVKTYKFRRTDLSQHIVDPEFRRQWHLEGTPGVSLNINAALKQGIDGKGVVVAIVDDGVDIRHPDLSGRLDRALCWDFNDGHGTDCSPYRIDGHGTAAAGLAVASRNSICGIGTGSGATLAGLRLIGGPTTDMVEAAALSYKRDKIDIYSNSWGPVDDGKRFSGIGRLTRLAISAGATTGRRGKGNIFVWAAGNGRRQGDNCNRDSYANSRHTISVGAINHRGRTSYYSEPCSELMVVVPSSGSGRGLVTSDLPGSPGYSSGDCTNKFGGTSGAAPQVAGVIANILQVRPTLTKRDVEGVLAKSAIRVNPAQPGWSSNARRYFHHHDYGFGRIDMGRTLEITRAWSLMPHQKTCTVPLKGIRRKIPYAMGMYGGIMVGLDVPSTCGITFVEHIEVKTFIRHPRRGRVVVKIKGPEGIVSNLANSNTDYHKDYPIGGWTFGSVRHWGSKATGRWTFSVYDSSAQYGRGTVEWVQLTIYGH